MDPCLSRRKLLRSGAVGALVGLAGCSSVTSRLDRGNRSKTVKKTYQPGDLSTTLSLEEGQAVARKMKNGKEVGTPHRSVSVLFHTKTGEELPLRAEDPPGAVEGASVGYADGIGAPTSGKYACVIVPSMPRMDEQVDENSKVGRRLEIFGEASSYNPIGENPYPIGDAVELLETARENFGTTPKGYYGNPVKRAGYPIPMRYHGLRTDYAGSRHMGVEGSSDPPIDEEVIYVPGNRLFELVAVELVRTRTVKSLSDSEREEYLSRLTAILPAVYNEYGLVSHGRELTDKEDKLADQITDVVLNEMGTGAARVAERVTDAISAEIGGSYEWQVSNVTDEATVEDPTMAATWFLTGESEIDISDDGVQFEPIENVLPSGVSPVFDLSISIPFSCITRLELDKQFLIGLDVETESQLRNARVHIDYKS